MTRQDSFAGMRVIGNETRCGVTLRHRDKVDLVHRDAALRQHAFNRLSRITALIFQTRKTLFFASRDDASVAQQGRRRVVAVVNPQHNQAPHLARAKGTFATRGSSRCDAYTMAVEMVCCRRIIFLLAMRSIGRRLSAISAPV